MSSSGTAGGPAADVAEVGRPRTQENEQEDRDERYESGPNLREGFACAGYTGSRISAAA